MGRTVAQGSEGSRDLQADRLGPTQSRATHDDPHEGAAKPRREIDPRQKIGRRHRIGTERKAVRRTPGQNELRIRRGGDKGARIDAFGRSEETRLKRDDVTADRLRDRDSCRASIDEPALGRHLAGTQLAQVAMERVGIDSNPDCQHRISLVTIPLPVLETGER